MGGAPCRLIPGFPRRKGDLGPLYTFSLDSKLIVTPTDTGTIVMNWLEDLFEDVQ